jgi:hypothetical protein
VDTRVLAQPYSTPIRTEYDPIRPRIRRQPPRVFLVVSHESAGKNINTNEAFLYSDSRTTEFERMEGDSGVQAVSSRSGRNLYPNESIFLQDTNDPHRKFGAMLVHSVGGTDVGMPFVIWSVSID